MLGSYLIPRSICSSIPKPKLPVLLKLLSLTSYKREARRNPSIPWVQILSHGGHAQGCCEPFHHERWWIQRCSRFFWYRKNGQCIVLWMNSVQTKGAARTFTVNTLLVSKLGEHLGGSDESITALTNADVQDELFNVKLTHHIGFLGRFGRGLGCVGLMNG